jgi:nicotinic acid phosphoribosyltransferase
MSNQQNRLFNNGNFNQSDSLYDLFIDIIDRHRNKSNEEKIELLNNILDLKKNSNKKINLSDPEIISALDLLINWVDHNNEEVESILNMFDLEGNSFEPLSATTFNDYYKWSMMPVIRAIEKSELMEDKDIDVTFGVNIRSDEYRKLISENKDLRDEIIKNLEKLKDRKFDRDLFKKIIDEKKLKIDTETIDLICGPEGEEPRSLIDDVIYEKYIPSGKNRDKIVISFYEGNDQKLKLQKNKALTNSGNNNAKKNKAEKLLTDRYYIEASGPWHKVTWLETTLMQCVYKTLLEYKLKKQMMSYANWLFGAMFRCSASVNSVLKLEDNSPKIIKGALFTGRRTGGYAFMLMQNLFVNDNYGNCIGTSSVNSWNDISKIRRSKMNANNRNNRNKPRYVLPPVGTHAHELSMVISALIPQVDKNYPLTQIIGHYLYYYTSPEGSPSPMLPDTLSTRAFMEIASLINVKDKITLLERPFLSIINSARQDSGEMKDFAKILKTYKPSLNNLKKDYDFTNNIMASEIENTEDLRTAFNHPQYKTFGAGGFFGDSEKALYTNTENISMAVKAVRVYINGEIAFENTEFETYPAKTGNSNSNSKLEVNTLLNSKKYKTQVNKAKSKRNENYAINTPV